MRYRTLGRTGLRVSELFLGAMTFGEHGGVGAPLDECRRMLDRYADAGGNVVDTAINYRGGLSEEFVGRLLDGRRDRFVLATKYSVSRDGADPNAAGNHRKNLVLSLETSLRRLRTHYVDLYWVHIWDRLTPVEETMRASTTPSARARSSPSGSPTHRRGSSRAPTRSRSGGAGPRSPACRCRTASSTATSSASCCRWPTRTG